MTLGVREPTAEEVRVCGVLAQQCTQLKVGAGDFRDWEAVLMDPERNPLTRMEIENQKRSDCQGNATANGEEFRHHMLTGKIPKLSEMAAYSACEYLMHPSNCGDDQGSSVHSGCRLLTQGVPDVGWQPGIPLESDWPYELYPRNAAQFIKAAKAVQTVPSFVREIREPAPYRDQLALFAAGASLHLGIHWSGSFFRPGPEGKRILATVPRSGFGGHALEGIWGRYVNNQWLMAWWNSHNDGWVWVDEARYEALRRNKFAPFGAFCLMPDEIVERYDRITQGGGYFR